MYNLPESRESLVILTGYVLGCFASGYYLVRWRTGDDVRVVGSGSAGATNVGRVLGWQGFWLTVSFDFLKGFFAVWLAEHFHLKPAGVMLTLLAVVAGHIWPVQLWFRGGRGVATALGGLTIFDHGGHAGFCPHPAFIVDRRLFPQQRLRDVGAGCDDFDCPSPEYSG